MMILLESFLVLLRLDKNIHLLRFDNIFFYDKVSSMVVVDWFVTLLFIIYKIYFLGSFVGNSPFRMLRDMRLADLGFSAIKEHHAWTLEVLLFFLPRQESTRVNRCIAIHTENSWFFHHLLYRNFLWLGFLRMHRIVFISRCTRAATKETQNRRGWMSDQKAVISIQLLFWGLFFQLHNINNRQSLNKINPIFRIY